MLSLKSNLWWFFYPTMFFLGNYAKMGLLNNKEIHSKIFVVVVTMFLTSFLIDYPEVGAFLKIIPFIGNKLPELTAGVAIVSPVLIGPIIKINNDRFSS